jgi:hypothetical protein
LFPPKNFSETIHRAKQLASQSGFEMYPGWSRNMTVDEAFSGLSIDVERKETLNQIETTSMASFRQMQSSAFKSLPEAEQQRVLDEALSKQKDLANQLSDVANRQLAQIENEVTKMKVESANHIKTLKWINRIGISMFIVLLVLLVVRHMVSL